MIWQFTSSGKYSSQSLYKIINFRGIKPVHVSAVWSLKIPPRVHFFLWLLIHNITLTRDNLAKRRKLEDECCLFCTEEKSVHHVFFECVVAKQFWAIISDAVGIGTYWLSNKKHTVLNMVSSAVLWSIYKLRNDIYFQNIGWRSIEMLTFRVTGRIGQFYVLHT